MYIIQIAGAFNDKSLILHIQNMFGMLQSLFDAKRLAFFLSGNYNGLS